MCSPTIERNTRGVSLVFARHLAALPPRLMLPSLQASRSSAVGLAVTPALATLARRAVSNPDAPLKWHERVIGHWLALPFPVSLPPPSGAARAFWRVKGYQGAGRVASGCAAQCEWA